ncbi:MAG TPA: hypothetical protein DEB06_08035 [Phycisphaerales bacterium]|nr:hypothetical protein [Phycisphaerales bacterium]
MFGLIGLGAIPIQLTPTVDRPIITVTTNWPGRSPQEIVDEITKEQEERLKNVSNLKSMRSVSREGTAEVTLEFYVGSDISRALQDVSDSLRQVPEYPEEVDEPFIKAAEGAAENAIAWIIIDVDPAKQHLAPDFDVSTLFLSMDREVKPYIERIDGVAEVNVFGGRDREVRVLLDPVALAQRGLSHQQVIDALRNENRNVSAGTIAEGKRDYRVRVVGQFDSDQDVLDTIVAFRAPTPEEAAMTGATTPRPVYVRDVGTVEVGYEKRRGFVRSLGQPSLAMNVIRQSNANVMDVMADVRARLEEVRAEILPKLDAHAGPYLRLRQVYDETTYITSAIDLVLGNLWKGGLLAVVALLVFLRSLRSTLVVALSIPISIIGTFLVMLAAGRTLNVISLAGLAFATGMVVDNAIVVIENIDRRRLAGDAPLMAVYRGAKEVWTAVLASTLTTVAVFIPILTIREEAGQLFFDLTLALAVSVSLSLIVSITVVPSATAVLFRGVKARAPGAAQERRGAMADLFGLVPLCARMVNGFASLVYWLMTGWRGWTLRPVLIVVMTGASIVGSIRLTPPLDYLPAGNRNLVFGGLLIPPGQSVEQMEQFAERIEAHIRPYLETPSDQIATLPPIMRFGPPGPDGKPVMFRPVGVDNCFIGAFNGGMFVGGTSREKQVVIPIGSLLTGAMNSIPDAFGGASQASLFGRGVAAGGNTINLEISGPRLDRVKAAAGAMFMQAAGLYGFGNVRPDPANFNLTQPEFRVRVTDAGRELGLTTRGVGTAVRGLFDGAFAGDFFLDGRKVDLSVLPLGGRLEYKEQLASVPVATPAGKVVPIDSLVNIVPALAPQEVQRIEELPSVTVRITPPEGRALEGVMGEIREKIVGPAEAAGLIDRTMRVRLEGTAAQLDEVRGSLFGKVDRQAAGRPMALWQRALAGAGLLVMAGGLVLAAVATARAVGAATRRSARARPLAYGVVGSVLLGLVVGGLLVSVAMWPELGTARFIWALAVTYLLMAALFESFLFPLVIMFSVPLAVVGGFGALRLVHEWTAMNPTIAPQQLDVLTMIGFIILIGTVVNNAILLVEQALNFMNPPVIDGAPMEESLPPLRAIAESVRTRVRPILMTTMTTLGGGLPLVIAPGAGSEMYRGLGAVVIGGLFVSAFFTLMLVPMVFSLTLQMREGVRSIFTREARDDGDAPDARTAPRGAVALEAEDLEPAMARRAIGPA